MGFLVYIKGASSSCMAYVKAMENAGPHITALYTPISLFRRFYVNFCISLYWIFFLSVSLLQVQKSPTPKLVNRPKLAQLWQNMGFRLHPFLLITSCSPLLKNIGSYTLCCYEIGGKMQKMEHWNLRVTEVCNGHCLWTIKLQKKDNAWRKIVGPSDRLNEIIKKL